MLPYPRAVSSCPDLAWHRPQKKPHPPTWSKAWIRQDPTRQRDRPDLRQPKGLVELSTVQPILLVSAWGLGLPWWWPSPGRKKRDHPRRCCSYPWACRPLDCCSFLLHSQDLSSSSSLPCCDCWWPRPSCVVVPGHSRRRQPIGFRSIWPRRFATRPEWDFRHANRIPSFVFPCRCFPRQWYKKVPGHRHDES